MKVFFAGVLAIAIGLSACNNETKEAVNDADSTNKANGITENDSLVNKPVTPERVATDKEGSEFLVRAASGGSMEVKAAKLGQEKSQTAEVKRFSDMLVRDHEAANMEVAALAGARQVSLPAETMSPMLDDMAKLEGNKFDRKYMDQMVKDHKNTIDLFEKCNKKTSDTAILGFIQKTLPVLKQHLDSAQAIEKMVKKAK